MAGVGSGEPVPGRFPPHGDFATWNLRQIERVLLAWA